MGPQGGGASRLPFPETKQIQKTTSDIHLDSLELISGSPFCVLARFSSQKTLKMEPSMWQRRHGQLSGKSGFRNHCNSKTTFSQVQTLQNRRTTSRKCIASKRHATSCLGGSSFQFHKIIICDQISSN